LWHGDRLSRDEFERRYDAMPDLKKAVLIEGVVYLMPEHGHYHLGEARAKLIGWMGQYEYRIQGIEGSCNGSIRMEPESMAQPDVTLFLLPENGGRVLISDDDYLEGGPELVAHVVASRASYPRHANLSLYRRNGIRECLFWSVLDRDIEWLALREHGYDALREHEDGILRSEVSPGLWLDPDALIEDDCPALIDVIRRGLDTPEYTAFVERLRGARP
jgi:hypothetical protein